MDKFDHKNKRQDFTRVNFSIRVPSVRVVKDGEQLGVMPTDKARKMAQDLGLDLVEISPSAKPPVCSIVDYEKYRYQQKQREKELKRKQKESACEIKEVRLRPGIMDHDIEVKVSSIKKFLMEGKKVQLNLQYKNREITHKEEGYRVINKIIEALKDVAVVEKQSKMEGFKLTCRLEAKPGFKLDSSEKPVA